MATTKTKKKSRGSPKFKTTHNVVTFTKGDIAGWRRDLEDDDVTEDEITEQIVEEQQVQIEDFVRDALECDPRQDIGLTIYNHLEKEHPRVNLAVKTQPNKLLRDKCPECKKLREWYKAAEKDWLEGKL